MRTEVVDGQLEVPSVRDAPAEATALAVSASSAPGSLLVHRPLAKWARRAAAGIALLSPFMSGVPLGPCVLAAFLYGHLGQAGRRRGSFFVDGDGLRSADGSLLLARASFGFAFPLDRAAEPPTICFTSGPHVVAELRLDSFADRTSLLQALGYEEDPELVHIEGSVGPELRAIGGSLGAAAALAAFVTSARHDSVTGLLLSAVVMVTAIATALRRDIRAGRDGVYIAAPFRRRWVSFEELRGVSVRSWWIRLHTDRGDLDVATPMLWSLRRASAARERLATLIRRSKARYDAAPNSAALCLRESERRLPPPSEGGFREAPVSSDDLVRVVENPRAHPADRVRAATSLLRADRSAPHEERVRTAAARCASPKLERALRAVAAGESSVYEALAALER